jgi:hypothetical protein
MKLLTMLFCPYFCCLLSDIIILYVVEQLWIRKSLFKMNVHQFLCFTLFPGFAVP